MKYNIENQNELVFRARNLAKNKEFTDLEESVKLFKIYATYVQSIPKKIGVLFETYEISVKLVATYDCFEKKFWQFKISSLLLIEVLKYAKGQKPEEFEKTKLTIVQYLKELFLLFSTQKIACYEFYSSFYFKNMIAEKFGNKLLLKYLAEKNSEITEFLNRSVSKEGDIYALFKPLYEEAFLQVQTEKTGLRPVSSEYFVPICPEDGMDYVIESGFDKEFYNEFSAELRSKLYESKDAFLRFLLKYYQIEIKNGVVLRDFDSDVLSYSREIFSFFFGNQFNDPTEKQIVRLVQNGIRQMRWI